MGSQPWTEEQEALISEKIEHFYERFLRAVAKGRKMSRDEVHEVAQGRVWLGTDAKEKGLVDHLGGLDAAINRAVELAGIHRNYDVLEYPEVTWQSALRSAASPSLIEASEDVSTLEVWMRFSESLCAFVGTCRIQPGRAARHVAVLHSDGGGIALCFRG